MNIITEKNSFPSNSIWEEVSDKKVQKELFILILEGKLSANDEKYLPQWKSLLYALIELNTKEDLIEHFLMPSFAECFFDKILTSAVKSILACKKLVNKEFNQVLDAILVQTLLLWSKNLRNCPQVLWKIVYNNILEQDNHYYNIEKSMLDLESPLETSSEHFAWLQTLKKGDIIDCVKTTDKYRILKVWSHAEIISVNDKAIMVSFIKDRKNSQEIKKTASCHEIAPYKTKCDDFEWRMGLKAGDEVDAREKRMWNKASVIETRENLQGEKEILIGFRTYSEEGDRVDSKGRKCFGDLEEYDEWFNATSPFITKNSSMIKTSTFEADGNTTRDLIDIIFKPSHPEKTVYAVYQEGRCKSITFVNIINQFGEQGGFENISQTLLDRSNPIPSEKSQKVCQPLSLLSETLHRTFVIEYVLKLQDYWGTNDTCRGQLCNFLNKVYSDKTIKRIVASYRTPKAAKGPELTGMDKIRLIEYLEQHGLPQQYLENSEKRNELFYVDVKRRTFTMDQVARLWVATKPNNKATIDTMCREIIMIFYNYYTPERTFFTSLVDHLFETNPEDLAEGSLELLMKIFSSATTVPEGYGQKFYNFLQNSIYSNIEKFSYDVAKSLNRWLADLSNDILSTDEILQILYKCIDNVAHHTLGLLSLNMIGAFGAYKPKADKKFSQQTYLQHLCEEKNLMDLVLQEFRFTKQQLAEKTQGQKITIQILESLLPMKIKYIDDYVSGMTGTVMFLHTKCPGNRSKADIIKELWDITVKNALIPKEKVPILREIQDIMVSKDGPSMNEDDLKFLINELNCIQSPTDLCYQAYECYVHLFVTLHEKLGNIYDIMLLGPDYNLNSTYDDYRYEKFVRESYLTGEQCFEFKVRVPPQKLEGFDQIWKFMIFSEEDQVVERATDFHAMVYSNIDKEFCNQGESLWKGFLTPIKKYLTEILKNKESISAELLNKRCSRCVKSVIRMLHKTEKSIPREFQSHWKLNHRGNIRIFFPDINKEDIVQMNLEQTVGDLLDEYEKKKGVKANNQVGQADTSISYYPKRYLPLYETGVRSGSVRIEENKPILGHLVANRREDLDPRAKVIFTKWFEEFSTNGMMSPDQFGMFLNSVKRDINNNNDLIKNTFESYDKDRDGLLNLENFLTYYHNSCVNRPLEVWSDIATRGELYGSKFYNFDEFGKVQEAVEPKPEISPSLRSQVSLDKELFELLYSLLNLEGGNDLVFWLDWLLQRLPTNSKLFSDIVMLKGVRGIEDPNKRDWRHVFTCKSPNAFVYILDIIDYLFTSNMEEDIADETRESMSGGLDIWVQNPELLEYKQTWCQNFIKLGGSKHLAETMEKVKKHPDFQKGYSVDKLMEKVTQRILTFLCFYTEGPQAKNSTL